MDRRRFLKSLGLGVPALAFPLAKAVRGAHALPEKLPNIVLIMADDMGLGDPGCYNPESLIPTPQMDRISAEGTKFTGCGPDLSLCFQRKRNRYSRGRRKTERGYSSGRECEKSRRQIEDHSPAHQCC